MRDNLSQSDKRARNVATSILSSSIMITDRNGCVVGSLRTKSFSFLMLISLDTLLPSDLLAISMPGGVGGARWTIFVVINFPEYVENNRTLFKSQQASELICQGSAIMG